jgi:hypothetical protein
LILVNYCKEYRTSVYLPEGKENKAKPSGKDYMYYLYVFRMFHAVLARLCHSRVRRWKISHVRGRMFTLAPTGSCVEFRETEQNRYPLGIVQCWNVLEFQAVQSDD